MDGYFLCVKFSIATMSIATETISCNSSYVLIWHHLRQAQSGGSTSSGCPVKHNMFLMVAPAGVRAAVLIIQKHFQSLQNQRKK